MFDAIFGRSVKILKILAKVQCVLAFVLASMPATRAVALRSNDGESAPISTTYYENMNKNSKKPYRSRFRSAIIFYACYKNLK